MAPTAPALFIVVIFYMIQASLATHLWCFNIPLPRNILPTSGVFPSVLSLDPQPSLHVSTACSEPCLCSHVFDGSFTSQHSSFLPEDRWWASWGQRLYFLIVGSPGWLTGYTRYIPVKTRWTTINYTSLLKINEKARKVILGWSL